MMMMMLLINTDWTKCCATMEVELIQGDIIRRHAGMVSRRIWKDLVCLGRMHSLGENWEGKLGEAFSKPGLNQRACLVLIITAFLVLTKNARLPGAYYLWFTMVWFTSWCLLLVVYNKKNILVLMLAVFKYRSTRVELRPKILNS